jgi:hypothetical protein
MKQVFRSGPVAERARRSAHQIALAVALTLAALAFVVAALHGAGSETASVLDPPAKPQAEPN